MDYSFALSSTFTPFHTSKHTLIIPSKPPFFYSSKTPLNPSSKPSISSKISPKSPFFYLSKTPKKPSSNPSISSNLTPNHPINPSKTPKIENPFAKTLQISSKTLILSLATSLITFKFNDLPLKAQPLPPIVEDSTLDEQKDENFIQISNGSHQKSPKIEDLSIEEQKDEIFTSGSHQKMQKDENFDEISSGSTQKTPLSHLMESNPNFVNNLWTLLEKKLDLGEDEEALKIVGKLVEAQPNEIEWKFLKARLLNEMGKLLEARKVFEDILTQNPLSFEALFENALLMDRCGEGEGVIVRLERALSIAMDENKGKEARDVRLIIAQVLFLQKKVDEALRCYEELCKEDPKDFRVYFCKGMIYSLIDRNVEAREEFAKYKEVSPREFDVDGYLRTPLSRMKLFGIGSKN